MLTLGTHQQGGMQVYKGSLMFALKDTPAAIVRDVRAEFNHHLERMVRASACMQQACS